VELAPNYGIEVIPGIEITTAEGDLLALNITEMVERGQSLIDTVLKVGELGGFCIAPHPMAGGFGMKSLSAYSIMKALRNRDVARVLIGIETYNATTLDRMSNHYAHILGERLGIAKLGNSDAHVAEAVGLGATEFEGHTSQDLLRAIRKGKTSVHKKKEWNSVRILGSWLANYVGSKFIHFADVA
jgi:predicted metal-dependent phosphoesterase TrpH